MALGRARPQHVTVGPRLGSAAELFIFRSWPCVQRRNADLQPKLENDVGRALIRQDQPCATSGVLATCMPDSNGILSLEPSHL